MICPKCALQMSQLILNDKPQGGGVATNEVYETWEYKVCKNCGRVVKEYYSCQVISNSLYERLKDESEKVYHAPINFKTNKRN